MFQHDAKLRVRLVDLLEHGEEGLLEAEAGLRALDGLAVEIEHKIVGLHGGEDGEVVLDGAHAILGVGGDAYYLVSEGSWLGWPLVQPFREGYGIRATQSGQEARSMVP